MSNRTQYEPPIKLLRYSLPNEKGVGWGIFVIGSDGYFSVISDFGNYAYFWTHAGMEFRKFLTQLDWHYVATKISPVQHGPFDGDRTVQNVKRRILELRRRHSLTKEEADEEWQNADRGFNSEVDFHLWLNETTLDDAYELAVRPDFPRNVEDFTKVLFPRFQKVLKDELEAEAKNDGRPTPEDAPTPSREKIG
jgi:hypothetical protein